MIIVALRWRVVRDEDTYTHCVYHRTRVVLHQLAVVVVRAFYPDPVLSDKSVLLCVWDSVSVCVCTSVTMVSQPFNTLIAQGLPPCAKPVH